MTDKVKVVYAWMDRDMAEIDEIKCLRCNHQDLTTHLVIQHKDKWKCPECGNEVQFRWVGFIVE